MHRMQLTFISKNKIIHGISAIRQITSTIRNTNRSYERGIRNLVFHLPIPFDNYLERMPITDRNKLAAFRVTK